LTIETITQQGNQTPYTKQYHLSLYLAFRKVLTFSNFGTTSQSIHTQHTQSKTMLQRHHRLFSNLLCLVLTLHQLALTSASTRDTALPLSVVSLKESANKWFSHRWNKARDLVLQEQLVEDYNADYIATASSPAQANRHRRLIALPLTDAFDPPMGIFSHGHVQTGDKLSLPQNFQHAITTNAAEVPWLFKVSRIPPSSSSSSSSDNKSDDNDDMATPPRVEFNNNDKDATDAAASITHHIPAETTLDSVVGGPLDFRAPTSYVFLPLWMMRALGLRPGEIVQVDLITTVAAGTMAKLRPHSEAFAKAISNPQAVLETELRHYSSLCKGSTIAMDYNGQRYWFDVADCKAAPKGESAPYIKVQDCDIATDFLTSREKMLELAKKKRQRQLEKALEE